MLRQRHYQPILSIGKMVLKAPVGPKRNPTIPICKFPPEISRIPFLLAMFGYSHERTKARCRLGPKGNDVVNMLAPDSSRKFSWIVIDENSEVFANASPVRNPFR